MKIERYPNESVERLLRRFKKHAIKENIISDMKKKMAYEKPGDAKRRKMKQCFKNFRKDQRERNEFLDSWVLNKGSQ